MTDDRVQRPEKYVSEVNRCTGDPMAWNYNVEEIDAYLAKFETELRDTKRALDLACADMGSPECSVKEWAEEFMQAARKEGQGND